IADIGARTLAVEANLNEAAREAKAKSDAAAAAGLAAGRLATEVETLAKVLRPAGDGALPPVLDQITVEAGYEMALAAALGDDLDAPAAEEAPAHWRHNGSGGAAPAAPPGADPLVGSVHGPPELARGLRRVGVVAPAEGGLLQPLLKAGQRLVSAEGQLWRWDGFVVAPQISQAAANRLAERSRLGALVGEEARLRSAAQTAL